MGVAAVCTKKKKKWMAAGLERRNCRNFFGLIIFNHLTI
jgi:hypothetical protein